MTTVLCTNAYKAAHEVRPVIGKGLKTLPILSCIHIYIHEGRLTMTSANTSGEVWKPQTAYVNARFVNEIDTCIPAKPFTDWLRVTQNPKAKHGEDQIELSFDSSICALRIKAGNTRAEFKCLNSNEFPSIKDVHLPLRYTGKLTKGV